MNTERDIPFPINGTLRAPTSEASGQLVNIHLFGTGDVSPHTSSAVEILLLLTRSTSH